MLTSRRHFLLRTGAVALGFAGLRSALARPLAFDPVGAGDPLGYGPLIPDPLRVLDLPRGFGYQVLSRAGETMDDGLLVPGMHDGMAAFPDPAGPPTRTILVRNHEIEFAHRTSGAFGPGNELLSRVDPSKIFDRGGGLAPSRGGPTTLVYDTGGGMGRGRLEGHWLSLAGTERNCAGGPTPRNTWISCEESVVKAGFIPKGAPAPLERDHGWCFEVPAVTERGLVDPVPIKAMGRFYHEACATNPQTGIVYMTEDRQDGVLYRFIPEDRDHLLKGGRLQALGIVGKPSFDTRNWEEQTVGVGARFPCRWLDVRDVESPGDTLRYDMYQAGATRFSRGEGMWMGRDAVYWCCTDGGRARQGQIWRYRPAPPAIEGTPREAESPGILELFVEPNDKSVVNNPDNLTVAPWGDLIVCEDGEGEQFLLGVTARGQVYKLGRNALNESEFAGCTFSPDGTTLFVNVQALPGMTLAVWGPWRKG